MTPPADEPTAGIFISMPDNFHITIHHYRSLYRYPLALIIEINSRDIITKELNAITLSG